MYIINAKTDAIQEVKNEHPTHTSGHHRRKRSDSDHASSSAVENNSDNNITVISIHFDIAYTDEEVNDYADAALRKLTQHFSKVQFEGMCLLYFESEGFGPIKNH